MGKKEYNIMDESREKIIFAKIDELLESKSCYIIDVLPKKVNCDYSRFSKLEAYLVENYIKEFARKISNIIIKLMYYFETEVYRLELIDGESIISHNYADKDLVYISNIIKEIVENFNNSWVQIICKGENTFLINLNGQFSVNLYNVSLLDLDLINMLVKQEGLFIRIAE